jgi:hypothetical protein
MNKRESISSVSVAIRKTMVSLKSNEPLMEPQKRPEFHIKIANTLEERESVFRLAYQIYRDKGYIQENGNQWLLNPYDTAHETIVFIVQDQQKNIVGSITTLFDSPRKLPADKIYKEELQSLRQSGKKMAEISPDYRNSKEILVLLFNYMAIYAYHVRRFDNLIIEVNPRHKEYYKSILCFEEIGAEKPCPQVQNAPAILLSLPLKRYQSEVKRCHQQPTLEKKERTLYPYFLKLEQENLVASYLEKQAKPMSADEKIYFGFAESGFSKAVCI